MPRGEPRLKVQPGGALMRRVGESAEPTGFLQGRSEFVQMFGEQNEPPNDSLMNRFEPTNEHVFFIC